MSNIAHLSPVLSAADLEYLESIKPCPDLLAGLSPDDREQVQALSVLREMFYLQERQSPSGKLCSEALSAGIVALQILLEDCRYCLDAFLL